MALPAFRDDGWLPEGPHQATWEEIVARFGDAPGSQRARVLSSLLAWRDAVLSKGMGGLVILNGSFISRKEAPGDFDLVFFYDEATKALVLRDTAAKALTDYQACRAAGFSGDVFAFPASLRLLSPLLAGTDMFDFDRRGTPKGVVEVLL